MPSPAQAAVMRRGVIGSEGPCVTVAPAIETLIAADTCPRRAPALCVRSPLTFARYTLNRAGKRSGTTNAAGRSCAAGSMRRADKSLSKRGRHGCASTARTSFMCDGGNSLAQTPYPVAMACQSVSHAHSSPAIALIAGDYARPVTWLHHRPTGCAPHSFLLARPCQRGRASCQTGNSVSQREYISVGCTFDLVPMPGNGRWGGLAERAQQFTHTASIDG